MCKEEAEGLDKGTSKIMNAGVEQDGVGTSSHMGKHDLEQWLLSWVCAGQGRLSRCD